MAVEEDEAVELDSGFSSLPFSRSILRLQALQIESKSSSFTLSNILTSVQFEGLTKQPVRWSRRKDVRREMVTKNLEGCFPAASCFDFCSTMLAAKVGSSTSFPSTSNQSSGVTSRVGKIPPRHDLPVSDDMTACLFLIRLGFAPAFSAALQRRSMASSSKYS